MLFKFEKTNTIMPSGRKFWMYMVRVKNHINSIQKKIELGQSLGVKDNEFLEHQYKIYREHYESDTFF